MWASGDFAVIGTTIQIVGEMICEAVDLRGGERVLDVAAGNGNATLAAARRFGIVTSTDYVPALLERGRKRAEAEGADVTFQVADAEALPFPDASFDVVLSTFGVMFAPNHELAARELMRVCRPGGRIGLACWTPAGFLGMSFAWSPRMSRRFQAFSLRCCGALTRTLEHCSRMRTRIAKTARFYAFRYRSPEHWLDVFRTYYGPVHKAFAALDADGQSALEADLLALLRRANKAGASGLVIPAEYLETVITK